MLTTWPVWGFLWAYGGPLIWFHIWPDVIARTKHWKITDYEAKWPILHPHFKRSQTRLALRKESPYFRIIYAVCAPIFKVGFQHLNSHIIIESIYSVVYNFGTWEQYPARRKGLKKHKHHFFLVSNRSKSKRQLHNWMLSTRKGNFWHLMWESLFFLVWQVSRKYSVTPPISLQGRNWKLNAHERG